MSLTSPLGLMRHVRRPDLRMEVIPWLNVLALGGMLYLLSSSYIWAPGLVVGTDSKTPLPLKMTLPGLPSSPGNVARVGRFDATLDIITSPTSKSDTIFILNNGRFTFDNLLPALEKKRKTLPGPNPVLLIKSDNDVSGGVDLQVMALARQAGFDSVLMAYQPIGSSAENAAPAASTATANASNSASSGKSP